MKKLINLATAVGINMVLICTVGVSPVRAASTTIKAEKKNLGSLHAGPYSAPMAVLSTPEKRVEVFRLTQAEHPQWTYMVVEVDENGSRIGYGDEQTVGQVLETLTRNLKSGWESHRCPASVGSGGWQFEKELVKASVCSAGRASAQIERAVGLLETVPTIF